MSTVIFTLAQGNYGPVTHFKSPSYVPQAGTTDIQINFSISASDLADPTKSFTIFMETSPDGGNTWNFVAGEGWTGGQLDKHGNPAGQPRLDFGVGASVGQKCRLDITTGQTINMGAQVVALP